MSEQTIPEWAIERALDAVNAESRDSSLGSQYRQYGYADMVSPPVRTLARYIAEHEEPPEDPLLIEAREICADKAKFHGNRARAFAFVEGHSDETENVQLALAALRRGIELGKAGEA